MKVTQILPINCQKSGSQKWKIFQSKTFGFNKILSCFISLNTIIFSYKWISHIPSNDSDLEDAAYVKLDGNDSDAEQYNGFYDN